MIQGSGERTIVNKIDVQPVVTQTPSGQFVIQGDRSPQAVYRALRDQRDVLGEQLRTAQRTRDDLVRQLQQQGGSNEVVRVGIEKRIANIDVRITEIEKQIAVSDAAVSTAAAIPGATVRNLPPPRTGPDPDMIVGLSFATLMLVAFPLAVAYARRIWRRSAKVEVTLPPEMRDRMDSLERGVEAIALEVERIGEGQRFLTNAMADRVEARPRAVAAGDKQASYLRPGDK
jgi:hypothetical protein